MTYNIPVQARLVDACDYGVKGAPMALGFLSGLCAGNYDITDIFVDSVLKIGGADLEELAGFVEKLAKLEANIVMSVSAAKEDIPARVADLAQEI